MTDTDDSDRPAEAPTGASDGDAALLSRFRFYFAHRHDEPLAGLRARSLAAQLRPEHRRGRHTGRDQDE
jgi:hypothetical protein